MQRPAQGAVSCSASLEPVYVILWSVLPSFQRHAQRFLQHLHGRLPAWDPAVPNTIPPLFKNYDSNNKFPIESRGVSIESCISGGEVVLAGRVGWRFGVVC